MTIKLSIKKINKIPYGNDYHRNVEEAHNEYLTLPPLDTCSNYEEKQISKLISNVNIYFLKTTGFVFPSFHLAKIV